VVRAEEAHDCALDGDNIWDSVSAAMNDKR